MKTTNSTNPPLIEVCQTSCRRQLARLGRWLADWLNMGELGPLPPSRLMPIQVHPPVQFRPRLNFRRPSLDSLKDSGALSRMQLAPLRSAAANRDSGVEMRHPA